MSERKGKREESVIELGTEGSGFVLEPAKIEVGSGYAVSVSYDENEKQIVDVKVFGEVDFGKLRREIERVFPDARIRQLARPKSVTIVRKEKRKHRTSK